MTLWEEACRAQVREVVEPTRQILIEHYAHWSEWLEVEEIVNRIMGRPAPPKEKDS